MHKWADYLISKVKYDKNHLVDVAIRHKDTLTGITSGKPIDRLSISSDIKNGFVYITIYNGKNSWKKGNKIQTFSIDGFPYLRIDKNKAKLDYFGDLPEPDTEEEATPEQLTQLDDLQNQINELENMLSSQNSTISFQEEATPEQLTQLDDLQNQINELEQILETATEISNENSENDLFSIKKLEQEIKIIEGDKSKFKLNKRLQKQNKKLNEIEKKINDISSISNDAYCVKCKTKRSIHNPEETIMKNGRIAITGNCGICNCKVFRIGKISK